jgi:hypothetical protein
MASKRPATDSTDAPDSKRIVIDEGTSSQNASMSSHSDDPHRTKGEGHHSRQPQPGGIITHLARSFSRPFAIHDQQFLVVQTMNIEYFSNAVYTTIVNAIYPDSTDAQGDMITEAQFYLVNRYLMKARIDQVYSTTSGRRPLQRIAIPRAFAVPKCIADVINGIGVFTVNRGALTVIPQPEDDPQEAAQRIGTLTTHAILTRYSHLVRAAVARNLLRTGEISMIPEGTAWWLLSPRQTANTANIAANAESIVIRSAFDEWTPADAIFCAMVQRHFNGNLNDVNAAFWSTDNIRGISSIRAQFALEA